MSYHTINLEDLETTSGETQAYGLLAISTAREARTLLAPPNETSLDTTA